MGGGVGAKADKKLSGYNYIVQCDLVVLVHRVIMNGAPHVVTKPLFSRINGAGKGKHCVEPTRAELAQ